LLALAGVLGAAVVVMPALASSEGAIEAKGTGPYEWSPMSVSVQANGAVSFSNPTTTAHGIEWVKKPAEPHCTAGVPVGTTPAASNTKWTGSCTFAAAGEYVFYCTVHGPYMSGKVIVSPNGETTVTSTPTTSTPGYPPPPTTPPYPGYETPAPQPSASGGAAALLAGSASTAVKVAGSQHGHVVHGSVAIAPAGQGARLEVDLFARSAVLASAGHNALARIGRLVVAHVHAGSVHFSVALSRAARNALGRRRRLAVTVHVTLQSGSVKPIKLTRSVLLRP
jgi:plastocyanin